MHKEHVESYRQQLRELQDRLDKLRMVIRTDLGELDEKDSRHFSWPRVNERITKLIDGLADLRKDLLDLQPRKGD
ncbi:MAG TPA: hypothetical protein VKX17_09940 [Planctomycetota bacterium]|nr:hypothetical protein [Planctomycetota bacterium]